MTTNYSEFSSLSTNNPFWIFDSRLTTPLRLHPYLSPTPYFPMCSGKAITRSCFADHATEYKKACSNRANRSSCSNRLWLRVFVGCANFWRHETFRIRILLPPRRQQRQAQNNISLFFAAFASLREILRFFWFRLCRAGNFVLSFKNRGPVSVEGNPPFSSSRGERKLMNPFVVNHIRP